MENGTRKRIGWPPTSGEVSELPNSDQKGAMAEHRFHHLSNNIFTAPQPSHTNPTSLTEIPDIVDSPTLAPVNPPDISNLSISNKAVDEEVPPEDEIPDMDDIPDMDEGEGLEDEDDAAVKVVRPSE